MKGIENEFPGDGRHPEKSYSNPLDPDVVQPPPNIK